MAAQVDERVVSMKFDNSQFESSASTTLNTLDRLKEALNFSGVDQGFNNITVAANSVSFTGMSSAIDSVKVKFSALEAVALSALNNIVNRAMSIGGNLLKSLTISPISDGFSEYERKIGSIQTIMANVNTASTKSANAATSSISKTASAGSKAASAANKQAQKDLKAAQKAETKVFQKEATAELKEFNKTAQEELDTTKESQQEQLEALADGHEEQLKTLQKAQKAELKELQNGYKAQIEALNDEQTAELEALETAHNQKLDLYEEEYLAKVKSIDEERYNELKAIQDQIDALNELTDAENKARKDAAKQEKLTELQQAADKARSAKKRTETAKDLADYEAELAEEQAQEDRKNQIELLKEQMENIKDTYDEKMDAVKDEYAERKALENETYSESSSTLRDHYADLKEAAQESYSDQLEALQEQQAAKRELLNEEYAEERKALQEQLSNELAAIQERQTAEREAIQERQSEERDALNERQSEELEAINSSSAAASSGVGGVTSTALSGINEVNKAIKEVTLEDVNQALDELNKYADKTIYNFGDMTSAIGRFTNAGVDLDTSVAAIKGFSNVAALSGSTAAETSRSMIQLSQAMGAGYMGLQDWNSLVANNTAGAQFQESLKETARVHGVAIDDMIAEEGSFRLTLSKGWMTADILLETLQKFTGDLTDEELKAMGYTDEQIAKIQEQAAAAVEAATKVRTWTQLIGTMREAVGSGWAETFELIFGNFDEATELWSGLNNVFGEFIEKQADERNQLLEDWKKWGGRDLLITGFKNVWESLQPVVKAVQEGFREIFPKTTYNQLVAVSIKFEQFTEKLKLSDKAIENVKKAVKGVSSVFSLVGDAIKSFIKVFTPSQSVLGGFTEGLLGVVGIVGDMLTTFAEGIKSANVFENVFKGFRDTVSLAVEAVKNLVSTVADWCRTTFFPPDTAFIGNFTSAVEVGLNPLSAIFEGALEVLGSFSKGWDDASLTLGRFGDLCAELLTEGIKKIGEKIEQIPELLETIKTTVHDVISGLFSSGKKEIDDGGTEIQNAVTPIQEFIKDIFDKIAALPETIENLGSTLGRTIGGFIHGVISSLSLGDIFKTVTTVEQIGILEAIRNFIKALTEMSKKGSGLFRSLSKGLTDISKSIREVAENFNKEKVSDVIWAVAKALGVMALSMFALSAIKPEALAGVMGALTVALSEFSMVIWKLNNVANKQTTITKDGINIGGSNAGSMIRDLGFAMLELAAAMKLISTIDVDQMSWALTAIGEFSLALIIIIPRMAEANRLAEGAGKLEGVKAFGFALIELGIAMKLMEGMDPESWATAMGSIAIFAGACYLAIPQIEKASKAAKSGGDLQSLISFGESLILLGISMRIIGGMSPDAWAQSMASVAVFAGILYAVVPKLYETSRQGEQGKLKGLITFGESLILLGISMRIIGGMNPSDWERAMVAVGGFAVAVGIVMPQLYKTSKSGQQGKLVGLLSFATALIELGITMRIVAKLEWPEIGKALVAMVSAAGLLVAAMFALYEIEKQKSFDPDNIDKMCNGMIKLAAAILILTPAMLALGSMDVPSIAKALSALAGVFIIVGVAAYALQPVAPILTQLGTSIALLGVGIAGIGVGLLAFSAALTALSVAGASVVGGFLLTMSGIFNGILDMIIDAMPRIGALMSTLLAVACKALLDNSNTLIETFLSLIEQTLISFREHIPTIVNTVADIIVEICDTLKERVPEIVHSVMSLVGTIISAVMEEIKGIDFSAYLKGVEGVGLLSALVVIIAGVSPLVGPAAKGLLKMSGLVLELTALLALMGAINQIPGVDWLINEGGDLLESIGTAIGKFIGGMAGGIAEGFTDVLPAIGTNLSDFMDNAQIFFDGIKDFKPETAQAIKLLSEAILILTAGELVDSLTKFFTGGESSLSKFGKELAAFAPGFAIFAAITSNINPQVVEGAANAAKSLAEMAAAIPNEGGVIAKWVGDNSLSKFGEELADFGPSILKFATSVDGLSTEKVQNGVNAAQLVADFAKTLPNEGGVVAMWAGDNTLEQFAKELALFGPSLMIFALSTANLKTDMVENAVNAAQLVADFAKTLPKEGGLVSLVTGDNSLSGFADELVKFGPSITEFADSVKDINIDGVPKAVVAGEMVAGLVKSLPKSGSIKEVWDGTTDFAGFATACVALGQPIKQFAEDTKGITADSAETATNVGMMIANLNNAIPDSGGLKDIFFGKKDLATFGDGVVSLGESLASFNTTVSTIDETALSTSIYQIQMLVNLAERVNQIDTSKLTTFGHDLTGMAEAGISELIRAFDDCKSRVEAAAGQIADYIITAIKDKKYSTKEEAYNLGRMSVDGVADGVSQNITTVMDAAYTICSTLKDQLKDTLKKTDFSPRGYDVVTWITEGITENLSTLTTVITDLAQISIINLLVTKLPKTRFITISKDQIMAGLAKGIENGLPSVKTAVESAATTVAEYITTAFYEEKFGPGGKNVARGVAQGIRDTISVAQSAARTLATDVYNTLSEEMESDTFTSLGENIALGIKEGIEDKTDEVEKAAQKLADSASETIANALVVESPSKLMRWIGNMVGEGFASGIRDMVSLTSSTSSDISAAAIDPINAAIQRVADSFESGHNEFEPTITPVVDLSNVNEAAGMISGMFGYLPVSTSSSLAMSSAAGFRSTFQRTSRTDEAVEQLNSKVDALAKQNATDTEKTTNYNTFNIRSTDPKQAAQEIGYIMQHQIERRKAAWAR